MRCVHCNRPTLLDSFACEGVGGSGYLRLGFCVTAVDMDKNRLRYYPEPDCPGAKRVVGDAVDFIRRNGWLFTMNHASPPCQGYTRGNAGKVTKWPKLIPQVREALELAGRPYVIENVADAAPEMRNPVRLCGCMFDMRTVDHTCLSPGEHDGTCDTENGVTVHLQRPRMFETNWPLTAPRRCEGEGRPRWEHPSQEWVAGAYGGSRRDKYEAKYIRKGGYVPPDKDTVKALLGVTHNVTWQGLFESIPSAYTEHIGRQLLAHMQHDTEAVA